MTVLSEVPQHQAAHLAEFYPPMKKAPIFTTGGLVGSKDYFKPIVFMSNSLIS